MAVEYNRLNRSEYRQLEDLIASHKEDIESGKWTKVRFAELASRRIGRPITAPNVTASAKVMGVAFQGGRNPNNLTSLRTLAASQRVIARELVALNGQLGNNVSPELLALAAEEVEA